MAFDRRKLSNEPRVPDILMMSPPAFLHLGVHVSQNRYRLSLVALFLQWITLQETGVDAGGDGFDGGGDGVDGGGGDGGV